MYHTLPPPELSRRPLDGPFVVCDFGTADGGTSMDLITECIRKISTLLQYLQASTYSDECVSTCVPGVCLWWCVSVHGVCLMVVY